MGLRIDTRSKRVRVAFVGIVVALLTALLGLASASTAPSVSAAPALGEVSATAL